MSDQQQNFLQDFHEEESSRRTMLHLSTSADHHPTDAIPYKPTPDSPEEYAAITACTNSGERQSPSSFLEPSSEKAIIPPASSSSFTAADGTNHLDGLTKLPLQHSFPTASPPSPLRLSLSENSCPRPVLHQNTVQDSISIPNAQPFVYRTVFESSDPCSPVRNPQVAAAAGDTPPRPTDQTVNVPRSPNSREGPNKKLAVSFSTSADHHPTDAIPDSPDGHAATTACTNSGERQSPSSFLEPSSERAIIPPASSISFTAADGTNHLDGLTKLPLQHSFPTAAPPSPLRRSLSEHTVQDSISIPNAPPFVYRTVSESNPCSPVRNPQVAAVGDTLPRLTDQTVNVPRSPPPATTTPPTPICGESPSKKLGVFSSTTGDHHSTDAIPYTPTPDSPDKYAATACNNPAKRQSTSSCLEPSSKRAMLRRPSPSSCILATTDDTNSLNKIPTRTKEQDEEEALRRLVDVPQDVVQIVYGKINLREMRKNELARKFYTYFVEVIAEIREHETVIEMERRLALEAAKDKPKPVYCKSHLSTISKTMGIRLKKVKSWTKRNLEVAQKIFLSDWKTCVVTYEESVNPVYNIDDILE